MNIRKNQTRWEGIGMMINGHCRNGKTTILYIRCLLMILLATILAACNYPGFNDDDEVEYLVDIYSATLQVNPPDPGEAGSSGSAMQEGYLEDEPVAEAPAIVAEPGTSADFGALKPVGFVNYGTFNATVRAWTYIPLGSVEPAPAAPSASTVSDASTTGGDWPNTSRFISVPMGTYTWCIDWEEDDQDGDGYFDYYHYFTEEPTVLDENDSDELDFAEEVAISAPPVIAPAFEGKCGEIKENVCAGKTMAVNEYVINAATDNPPEVRATANTSHRASPEGIQISVTSAATTWESWMILWKPGDWIEATTSDPYTAFGVQIFGDDTIGWAKIFFDGGLIWEGDTVNYQIEDGIYGLYVEVACFPPGTHTMRVEAGQAKEGLSGWQGGVPVYFFGFRE